MADLSINVAEIRKNKYFIATPTYNGVGAGYCQSMIDLTKVLTDLQIEFSYNVTFNDSLLPRARNELVAKFLKSDCTHMLFIDGHMKFEGFAVLSMMNCQEDFLGLACPLKGTNWAKVKDAVLDNPDIDELDLEMAGAFWIPFWGKYDHDDEVLETPSSEPFETVQVDRLGTGFLLLSRNVFDTVAPLTTTYKNYKQDPELPELFNDFFPLHVNADGVYESEDLAFCRMWKRQGGKLYVCPWITVESYGSTFYRGKLYKSFPSLGADKDESEIDG